MIAAKQHSDALYAGFYNVGPDDCDCVATGSLVNMFCNDWGEGISWMNKAGGGPHEANFLKLDCSRLKNTFGWKPVWDINEAVHKTIMWSKVYATGGSIAHCMDRQIAEFIKSK